MMHSDLKSQFALARAIALQDKYCPKLLAVLGAIQLGYATLTINLSLEAAFRARRLPDGFSVDSLDQVWHPKPELVKDFGRANLPGQPLLYCSDGANTAIKEVGGRAGDRIAIVEMGLADPNVRPQIFSLGELRAREKTKKGVMGPELDTMLKKMRAMKIDMQRSMMVDGFYADVFRTPGPGLYPLTAAIAQGYLSPQQIDGIAYPTVATFKGHNLALKPESAARLLVVRRVKITRIAKPHQDTFFARDEKVSRWLHGDGRIEWQE
jgi:hypothetical protein